MKRNIQYDLRDAMFKKQCSECARSGRCTFEVSPGGPEEICEQLVIWGVYNCYSCLKRKSINKECRYKCVFFRKKPVLENAPISVYHSSVTTNEETQK